MVKTKLYNLFGLAMFFIVYSLQFFTQMVSPYLIYPIIAESTLIFLLIFIDKTFYKGLKSPFLFLLIILISLKITDTIFRFMFNFKIPLEEPIYSQLVPLYYIFALTISSQIAITMVWFLYSALKSYKMIKNLKIEPWIKKRYLIIAISSLGFLLNGILILFIPIEGDYENLFFTYTIAATLMLFSFGNLFGWLMPQKLKHYFNRNYSKIEDKSLSEKELLEKIKSELTGGDN